MHFFLYSKGENTVSSSDGVGTNVQEKKSDDPNDSKRIETCGVTSGKEERVRMVIAL